MSLTTEYLGLTLHVCLQMPAKELSSDMTERLTSLVQVRNAILNGGCIGGSNDRVHVWLDGYCW